jgi:hypothetical protein
VLREYDGYPLTFPRPRDRVDAAQRDADDAIIEEGQRREGLILCRRGHAVAHCQRREEVPNVLWSEISRVATVVKQNIPADPRDIDLLRPVAIAPLPELPPHELEEPEASRRVGRREEMRERDLRGR